MNLFFNDGSFHTMKAVDIVSGPPAILIGTWVLLVLVQLGLCIAG